LSEKVIVSPLVLVRVLESGDRCRHNLRLPEGNKEQRLLQPKGPVGRYETAMLAGEKSDFRVGAALRTKG
jgi:hypothetical protein